VEKGVGSVVSFFGVLLLSCDVVLVGECGQTEACETIQLSMMLSKHL